MMIILIIIILILLLLLTIIIITARDGEEEGDRRREVEYAAFTPLVFSPIGGMGEETTVAYRHLVELLGQR